ncbi:MAG TPA: hypothetical protein O0X53_00155, partial [Methanocorpusculum sp.]|nr:hypothetical protein [Methanocorpusculum sp.]
PLSLWASKNKQSDFSGKVRDIVSSLQPSEINLSFVFFQFYKKYAEFHLAEVWQIPCRAFLSR